MRVPRPLAVAGITLLAGAATVGVATADAGPPTVLAGTGRLVAQLDRPTPVSGYGDQVAFSAWDGAAFRLTLWDRRSGTTTTPRIAPRRVPFDVDLGPSATGGTTAVYSRCSIDPYYDASFAADRWSYTQGRGCDVYRLDLATGRERRVPGAARRDFSEMLPTVWRDRVAFARVPRAWTGRSVPQLRLIAGRRARAIRGGSADFRDGPTKLDSYGTRVVFEWATEPYRCTGPDEQSGSNVGNELWVVDTGRSGVRTRASRFCFQDRGPAPPTMRPSIGSQGVVAVRGYERSGVTSIVLAGPGRPDAFRPIASSPCVTDVTQVRGGIVVVGAQPESCGSPEPRYAIRVLSRP